MIELKVVTSRRTNVLRWSYPRSSFHANVDPDGARLGATDPLRVDFLRIATAVYLADRISGRDPRRWRREFQLIVPVSEPTRWKDVDQDLAGRLEFLSGDHWDLRFAHAPVRIRDVGNEADGADVHLFSGGADSFVGAALADTQAPILLSHYDQTALTGLQQRAERALSELGAHATAVYRCQVARRERDPWSGVAFEREPTSRARSIIFLGLAGVVAARTHGAIKIPENGFMSINCPLGAERRGTLTTRTTHPAFLQGIAVILERVGTPVRIVNPLETKTKGEIFRDLAQRYGHEPAARALARTHSCAKMNSVRTKGVNPNIQCGVCYPCLVRRAAFLAAKLPDRTTYLEEMFASETGERTKFLAADRSEDLRAVRSAVSRGAQLGDVLALGLPSTHSVNAALDLIRRGLAELAALPLLDDAAIPGA